MEQPEHARHLSITSTFFFSCGSRCPQTITITTSKVTVRDHHDTYNNNKKLGSIMRVTERGHRDKRGANAPGEMAPTDMLSAGGHEPSTHRDVSCPHSGLKPSEMRHARIIGKIIHVHTKRFVAMKR